MKGTVTKYERWRLEARENTRAKWDGLKFVFATVGWPSDVDTVPELSAARTPVANARARVVIVPALSAARTPVASAAASL